MIAPRHGEHKRRPAIEIAGYIKQSPPSGTYLRPSYGSPRRRTSLSVDRDFNRRALLVRLACTLIALFTLTGCLEQMQTTRIPSGSLSNFLLHLQAGELDDARAYFAPGLVTPSATLDASVKDASDRLREYEIRNKKYDRQDLDNGQIRETIEGEVRRRTPPGQPTPGPDEGWQQTTI